MPSITDTSLYLANFKICPPNGRRQYARLGLYSLPGKRRAQSREFPQVSCVYLAFLINRLIADSLVQFIWGEAGLVAGLMRGPQKSTDQKTEKKKHKRRRSSSLSSSSSSRSSSSSSTSSSDEEAKKKRKRRKAKKRLKKMKAKEKKKEKKERKRLKKMKKLAAKAEKAASKAPLMISVPVSVHVEKPQSCLETWQSDDTTEHGPAMTDEQKASFSTKRPMTKEEYEARQSVIRRVLDPATGRTRLIRGDGEVLEEIVSKERHKEINKQSTKEDGSAFQKRLGINRSTEFVKR
ncbi:hypothetical protein SRHO_G00261140 [Serrasalmus rhombeus]